MEHDYSKAHDTWFRQLQMIPMISETRARSLVEHYPTLQSLWHAYQVGEGGGEGKEEEETKMALLRGCFGSQKIQASLSATLYKVMTSNDPKEMV